MESTQYRRKGRRRRKRIDRWRCASSISPSALWWRVVQIRRRVHKPFCASLEQLCEEYYLSFRRENTNVRAPAVDVGASSAAAGIHRRVTVQDARRVTLDVIREYDHASRKSRRETKRHPRHLLLTLTRSSQQWVSSSGTKLKIVSLRLKFALADVIWIALPRWLMRDIYDACMCI